MASTPLNPTLPAVARGIATHSQPSRFVDMPSQLSVFEFGQPGTVGTGITDDSAVIQAAVNALAGTGFSLYFPAGTYLVGTAPTQPSTAVPFLSGPAASVTITGAGAAATQAMFVGAGSSGGPAFAMVNIVEAFRVDNTGATGAAADINAAMAALVLTGQGSYLPAGRYKIDGPLVPPSGAILWLGSGVVLESSMVPLGGQTNCIFRAAPTAPALPNIGTIHTAPVLGATTIDVDLPGPPTTPDSIWLQLGSPGVGAVTAQIFQIKNVVHVAGTHYTITLDREIVYPFTSGGTSTATVFASIPQDIHIYGNGALLTGTGDRYMEFIGAYHCHAQDIRMDGSGGVVSDSGCSWDVGSRDSLWIRVRTDMLGALGGSNFGVMQESAEGCGAIECASLNCVGGASFLTDGYGSYNLGCSDEGGSANGFYLGQGGGLGALSCYLQSCNARSTVGYQFGITSACKGYGLSYTGNAGGAAQALGIATTANGTQIFGMDASGCSYEIADINNDVDIDGLTGTTTAPGINGIAVRGGTCVRLSNFRPIFGAGSGGSNIVNVEASFTGRCEISHATITNTSNGNNSIYCQGGVTVLDHVVTAGAGTGCTGVTTTSGATVRIGEGCSFDSTATPLTTSGYCNRGTVVANGASAVDVAWPDLKSTERVVLSLLTKGGTPAFPDITYTPGTKFTLASFAGDTSTYNYVIV